MCRWWRACAGQCAAAGLEVRIPQRPCMDHVRPNLHRYGNVGRPEPGREAGHVFEERFCRPHLDQCWWKTTEVGIEGRHLRVAPIRAGRKIGIRQLLEISLVDEWIDGILGAQRSSRSAKSGYRRCQFQTVPIAGMSSSWTTRVSARPSSILRHSSSTSSGSYLVRLLTDRAGSAVPTGWPDRKSALLRGRTCSSTPTRQRRSRSPRSGERNPGSALRRRRARFLFQAIALPVFQAAGGDHLSRGWIVEPS